MSICTKSDFSYLFEQFTKSRPSRQVRAQHKLIDEEADQVFNLDSVSIGNVTPNNDIRLARVPVEKRLESRQQCHKQSRAFLPTRSLEPIQQRCWKHERVLCASVAFHGGAGP